MRDNVTANLVWCETIKLLSKEYSNNVANVGLLS